MRIVFAALDVGGAYAGGIGTYIQTVAYGLAHRGHSVTVVCLHGAQALGHGVGVVEVRAETDAPYRRLQLSRAIARKLDELAAAGRCDLVETTDWGMEGAAVSEHVPTVLRLHTPNSIVSLLNNGGRMADAAAVDRAEHSHFRDVSHLSSPSRAMVEMLTRTHGLDCSRAAVIPNPICLDSCHSLPFNRTVSGEFCLGFIGRLERRKGVYVLANALRELLPAAPSLRLDIIGGDTRTANGSVGRDVRDVLGEWAGNVRFLGHLRGAEKLAALQACHCVVLPSLWENFSYACLEAMACGRAVIGTRGCGFEEIIQDGVDGLLVEPGCPSALARGVLAMMSGDPITMGTHAARNVRRFATGEIIPAMEGYYRCVVEA